MKNHDTQELKPIFTYETNYSADDEVSLVDIAIVLVRHKSMVAIIATLVITLGVISALLRPNLYTFSTSIEIGSQIINGTIKPFGPPQTLLAKTQHIFIPHALKEQLHSDPENTAKYKIKATIPTNSVIIVLEIKGTEDNTNLLTNLLQNVTQQAIHDHARIYDAVRQNLIALKERSKAELSSFDSKTNNLAEKKRFLQKNIEVWTSQLANLRNTREILPPIKSIEPTNLSGKLIIIVAAFAGIFIGVFSAFLAELSSKVKQKINKEDKK